MKMYILIKIQYKENAYVVSTCWDESAFGKNLLVKKSSRCEAVSSIRELISFFIEHYGRRYIESDAYEKGILNCPSAYIEIPIDNWHCKETKNPCSIQGQIDLSKREQFFKFCSIIEDKKEGIWNALIKGKYKGFHHMPHRYKCVLCDKSKITFNYHYPWELTSISVHCDTDSISNNMKRRSELILNDLFRVFTGAICSQCFIEVFESFPEIVDSEYEIIEYDYQRNK